MPLSTLKMMHSHLIRLAILIFTLLFSSGLSGQIEKRINQVLLNRSFKVLERFAQKYGSEKDTAIIRKGNVRDIAPGFQESIFYITKSYFLNKAVSILCSLRLHILKQGDLIVYFQLKSRELKNLPKSFEETSDTTYTFRNDFKLGLLKEQFSRTYGVHLDENELFIDSIYYGQSCGHGGSAPAEQNLINSWVRTSDTLHLQKWLQSVNTEKQVYAVQGLNTLALQGKPIPLQSKKLIKYILDKKGTINTCIICDSRQEDLSSITKQFRF